MNESPGLLPAATRLGRAALVVADLTATVEFYRDVVGLAVLNRESATTTLGAGGTPLLEVRHDPDASPRPDDAAGLFHTAFEVTSREALGDALERIRDRWELTGASDHGVSEALYLRDPEGNGVEIYRDRPRAEWPRDEAGDPRIGTWPLDLEAVAAAAGGDSSDAVPSGTTVGHVHLEVASLEAARSFYVETLGFDVKTSVPQAVFLAAGDYHHHLGVNTWNGRSSPVAEGHRGLEWFELVVPSNDALESIRTRLEGEGVSGTDLEDGLEITDSDGIRIRLRAD
ncbi:VOC family protein [Haloterrigena alkaliphila]|uniref:VOC family protein n=1 Tax=Haloterrigena alkaliphila TaxID=2816475 RepID=A0A8A2VJA7_9EURY|nr:VOC family protein [Haloterrigena alkaliphila]QSX00413.1 VOC family protein [Haloterrigena alkaliphila]